MLLKTIVEEDIVNYKKIAMFIAFPNCTFKCEKECGIKCCQNSELALQENISVDINTIVDRYVANPLTQAIVYGGLEPLDSWEDLKELTLKIREKTNDDIVIYTGYKDEEIKEKVNYLKQYKNIIIKFGRFVPNKPHIFDPILGVNLASDNQYAKKVS